MDYSSRKAESGSTRLARQAGSHEARQAAEESKPPVRRNVNGPAGGIPKIQSEKKRANRKAGTKPTNRPTRVHRMASRVIKRTTDDRAARSAMRMPISRVRCRAR